MKTSIKGKVTTDHPLHKLYEAASEILKRAESAYIAADIPAPNDLIMPIWIDTEPVMKVTIEQGVQTTAEYHVFKGYKT